MASRADLDLAQRLIETAVLPRERVMEALQLQGALLAKGKLLTLARVLVHGGALPPEAAEVLEAPDPLDAQPFPGYRVDRLLGQGGSSRVYGGVYLANGTPVAVKVLHAVQALRADLRDRFYQEARLLVELEHENIVTAYEVGYEGGHHFFTMDWIEGPTVLEMIDRAGALDPLIAISVTVQIARALAYLHDQGLLHRDIKPGNVMLDATGRARLIDLGLVRRLRPKDGEETAEAEAVTVGTVEYISPEQARGRSDVDVRSDVYSLGVSLYHMVVGDVPFHGETDYEVMAQQVLAALDSQKTKTRRIPPEIHYFVTKMTSKDRDQRYATAAEAAADMGRFLPPGGLPPVVLPVNTPPAAGPGFRSPVVPPAAPHRPPRRN